MEMNFGTIKFVYENNGDHVVGKSKIVHEIGGESTIDEVIEAFEHFLMGMGFHLQEGAHIGYEYDEEHNRVKNDD